MIERSNFIGVLNAKRPTRPHLEANMAIIIEGEKSENQTSPKQPMCFSELYRKRPRRCDCKAGMNKDWF